MFDEAVGTRDGCEECSLEPDSKRLAVATELAPEQAALASPLLEPVGLGNEVLYRSAEDLFREAESRESLMGAVSGVLVQSVDQ